jgi:collagenase-like PrtC family protease
MSEQFQHSVCRKYIVSYQSSVRCLVDQLYEGRSINAGGIAVPCPTTIVSPRWRNRRRR